VRIISGTARGTQLATFTGTEIRPTSDRVRGAIFSILTSRIGSFNGLKVLDIFAGTGAMGLEALSRSATEAVFIDKGRQAKQLIETNCKRCKLEHHARIISDCAQTALPRLHGQQFDVIFMDPPYNKDLIPQIIQLIEHYDLMADGGIICAEEDKKAEVAEQIGSVVQLQQRNYGNTTIYLFSKIAQHLPNED